VIEMAAIGSTILKELLEDLKKYEFAFGYAPGMDTLTYEDWTALYGHVKVLCELCSKIIEKQLVREHGCETTEQFRGLVQ
jgi:hypothetical protein